MLRHCSMEVAGTMRAAIQCLPHVCVLIYSVTLLYVLVINSRSRLGARTTTALSAQLSRAMCKALSPHTQCGTHSLPPLRTPLFNRAVPGGN